MAEIDSKEDNAHREQSRQQLLRFFEDVLRDHLDDPEVIADEPIEDVEAYLREHGIEEEPFPTEMKEIIQRSNEGSDP